MTTTRYTPTPVAAMGLAVPCPGIYASTADLLQAIAPEAQCLHPGAGTEARLRWRAEVMLAVEHLLDPPHQVRCVYTYYNSGWTSVSSVIISTGTVAITSDLGTALGLCSE